MAGIMKRTLTLVLLLVSLVGVPLGLAQTTSPSPSPDSPPGAKPRRLRVSQGVAEANLIHKVEPQYPLEAKEKGIQGVVLLKVLIDRNGNIASCEQVEGDPVLGKASTEAVTQWKYRPYLLNGEPVDVETVIKVSFHMKQRSRAHAPYVFFKYPVTSASSSA
jgi:TonB family protein